MGRNSISLWVIIPGIHIYDFVVDAQDHIWLTIGGTGKSGVLYYFDDEKWTTIEPEPNTELGYVWADSVKGIWYPIQKYSNPADDVKLVHRIGMEVETSISIPFDDISIYSFNAFAKTLDGSIWLGGDGANRWTPPGQPGLYHFASRRWTRMLMDADIPFLAYGSCAKGAHDDMYFSSAGNVLHWNGKTWSVLSESTDQNLNDLKILDEMLWAHDRTNIYQYEDGQWVSVFKAPEYESISDYVVDRAHTLWIAGYDATKIWMQQDGSILNIPVKDAKPLENIKTLTADHHGNIYLATRYRLYMWDGESWQVYKDFGTEIQSFALVHDQPWVAVNGTETITNVYQLTKKDWKLIPGLNLETQANMRESVTGIYSSDNGKVIWLTIGPGYPRQGVVRYDLKTGDSIRITEKEGLADNVITDVCEDRTGALWFATWSGISRYGP